MRKGADPTIEILAVGSELLTPRFQDTNSLYLTKKLNELGFEVSLKTVVGDDWDDLTRCLRQAASRSELIITMGGLGPTEDDRTREALAKVLNRDLVLEPAVLQAIQARFAKRGMTMPDSNKKQAYIIRGAQILENKNGTAPGLWLKKGRRIWILLPGPPHELKPMLEQSAWPRLQGLRKGFRSTRVLKIAGLTESEMEGLISGLYLRLKPIRVTTLAYPGQLEIDLISALQETEAGAERSLDRAEKKLLERLGENVFSDRGEELEEVVGGLLRARGETLAVAESCTGGLLGHRLTNVPGSSDYFLEGLVTYSNQAKTRLLGIPSSWIQELGAVSPEVAVRMAAAVKEKAQADYGLAITGIAGPTGETPEKPIGLVFIALAWKEKTELSRNLFLGKREFIKYQSSQKALDMLRRHLLRRASEDPNIEGTS